MSTARVTPGRGSVVAMLLGAAVCGLDAAAIGYVPPALRAATGAEAQAVSWLVSCHVAATLVAVPAAAAMVRRVGAGLLLNGALLLSLLGAALAAAGDGLAMLVVARVLQGVGQGPLLPLAAARIAMQVPADRRGRLLGGLSLAYGVAFLVGTVVTPLAVGHDWRWPFALTGLLALTALALGGLRDRAARAAAAAVGAERPAHVGALARWRPLRATACLALGTGVGQAALVWFPSLAVQRLGVAPEDTMALMLPVVGAGLAVTVLLTLTLDRLGARGPLLAGAVGTLAGILLAAFGTASGAVFMLGAGLLGAGITALCGGPLRYAAALALPPADQGAAQGAIAWLTNVGVLAGSVLLGFAGDAASSHGLSLPQGLLAACVVMGVLFAPVGSIPARQGGAGRPEA